MAGREGSVSTRVKATAPLPSRLGFGAQPAAAFGEIAAGAGFPEKNFHFLDSQREFVQFGDLLTGQNLPSLRGRGSGAKAMEELPGLVESEAALLGAFEDLGRTPAFS